MAVGAFSADNGGSIPHALISIPNTASNDPYARACRREGLKPHPARFPLALAEFAIRLTTEPGDVVYDPFAGSLTTAQAAQALGRRWIASERSRTYLEAGRLRFPELASA
jgi:site-specific DNA-methyltransferase (cytosine-N4-specific)